VSKLTQQEKDLRRALRWCERLFCRVAKLESQLELVQHQMARIGGPLYRTKGNMHIERVRNLPEADYKLRTN